MMELSHSLTLNETALQQLPEADRPVFVFEWLRFLDKVLVAAQQADIKDCQKKLVDQLICRLEESPGPPTRKLMARCLATLFSVGDTFLLFDTVNKCNDILKNKDDSPSFLPVRLAAICCIGSMYEKLGRMMGRSYEETVSLLIRSLKGAESQTRIEIMNTLEKVCAGMGNAIQNMHKEVYKACRQCLVDRVTAVRCAAASCLLELLEHSPLLHTVELESLATLCFRAFDGSNYEARCAVAKLLAALVATTQQNQKKTVYGPQSKTTKTISLEEALNILMPGFLRGSSGFLKGTGEIIKGSSSINREVRLGVTHSYVMFVQILGGVWLESNMVTFLTHVLDLVACPKTASSHVDAVYSRRCVSFILRNVLGKMLGEKAQTSACKEILNIIISQMKSIEFNPETTKDCNQESLFSQHLLVCALQELGSLILGLGTSVQNLINDTSLNILEGILSVLIHPCYAARLAAAWCLRCVCLAVPNEITSLIVRCSNNLDKMRTAPEAVSGYSAALAAVIGSVRSSPLGVPHTKGKELFNTAEELLRSASQNSRLSLSRTQAGWLLIGSIMTLGVSVVRGLLPRMLLLWRNSFPRSSKELESEKARGDAFTWQVSLEGRAGALSSIHSLLLNCPEVVTEDMLHRLMLPIDCALAMLVKISPILKTYGQVLKAPVAMVRLRLYEILLLLPPQSFEGSYTHLLRMIVAEFTLTENYANTTTSLLRSLCHVDDSIILETWLQETGHYAIEDQLHCNSGAGLGALEHDYCCLYRQLPAEETVPGPLPLGVTVIDSSIQLFGQIFPRVANKHKLQMLDHFCECIKHSKSSRQEAIQMNVFAALLSGLRCVMEAKTTLGMEDVRKSAAVLITGALTSPNPILKCASAEALGRLAQVVKDVRFTAEMVQISCDRLKTARDVASRTGYSLALGCLHRYIGGMGANQHLSMSVSILLALARETPSPIVQVWSLQALALIAYSGGPMFRSYVERTLSLMLILLLNVPQSHISVYQCIGKVLASLITTIGPELQQGTTNSVCMVRSSFLCACSIMQEHGDPLVQAEATGCLQQLHLFAPKHVNLSSLVLVLCRNLSSNHLLLRKAAMSCLRQLAHREADEVCDHAMTLAKENHDTNTVEGLVISETGLPGVLFSMLDIESDIRLINDIHETLTSMLQSLVEGNLSQWLGICKDVLTESTLSDEGGTSTLNNDTEVDDQTDLGIGEKSDSSHKSIQPRWPTRVFATQCVRKIIDVCSSSTESAVHFDLCAAKDIQANTGKGDYLVCHLSDLVRIAFIAATSDSDPLRLEGLKLLQEVIEKFARVPEPEFPGHLLLEQSQAQVGAALRPAFSKGTPSHVTATACDVCSTWMGSGVARDLTDLRRVHQLLDSSLSKFESKTNDVKLYNESLSTLEKLAILKAWGEVYIIAMVDNKLTDEGNINEEELKKCESLLTLVQPQLLSLSKYWNAALRDYALLSLPPEFSSQLPRDRGAFYTTDTADCSKPHYFSYWSPILHAAALWLSTQADEIEEPTTPTEPNVDQRNDNEYIPNTYSDQFYLLFGICMQALGSQQWSERSDHIIKCLHGLSALLDTVKGRQLLTAAAPYPVELCCVLHRLQITHDTPAIQMLSIQVVKKIVMAAREHLDILRKQSDESEFLGEGGTDGELNPQKSVVVSVLNICVCILIRFFPVIHTPMSNSLGFVCSQSLSRSPIADKVLVSVINTLECLLSLCSPYGALEIAPIILHLTTEVIKEFNSKPTPPVQAALQCFTTVVKHEYCRNKHSEQKWKTLLKSTLIKIIDLSKTSNDDKCLNEATVMSIISIFVLNAPPEVICSPSLKYPCINHLRQCFQSENLAVKHKAVQIISSIFQHQDQTVTRPYIQALAPQLIDYLHSENGNRLSCNVQLTVTLEVIAAIETLVGLTEQQYRSELLSVLILVLINYLLDGHAMLTADKLTIALHEYSLKWLNKVGPKYPQEFKEIIGQSTYMRTRLESAIHNNQNTQVKNKQKPTKTKPTLSQVQPSIKLKTDFSNFS